MRVYMCVCVCASILRCLFVCVSGVPLSALAHLMTTNFIATSKFFNANKEHHANHFLVLVFEYIYNTTQFLADLLGCLADGLDYIKLYIDVSHAIAS